MQRVPRMLQYQRRKGRRGVAYATSPTASAELARSLLDALGSRLATVAAACSDQQLARALWALGVARHPHPEALAAASEVLPQRLRRAAGSAGSAGGSGGSGGVGGGMPMTELATAAWGLAAAAAGSGSPAVREPVRRALQEVARHLVDTQPADLSAPSALPPPTAASATTPAGAVAPAADEVAAAASAAALAADRPWLDPRSAVKLAWAFANADVKDAAALDVVAEAAAARIASQLQAHDPASGPLTPRATYMYLTIRGWQAWPRPRPRQIRSAASAARGGRSRYLYDDRPRVVLRDFTAGSLAQLLAALAAAGHRHEGLMQAAAAHLTASSGRSLRVDPHDLKRLAAAFARLDLAAPAGGGGAATAAALTALLSAAQLSALPAPLLARLTILAAESGVRRRGLYDRLVRQLMARAWVPGPEGQPPAAGGAVDGAAAAATPVAAAPLAVVDEAAAAAAAAAVTDPDDLGGPVALDPRARESHYARARGSGYDSAALTRRVEAEAAGWAGALSAPRDACSPALLARVLRSLAKVGYTASDPLALPFAARLFDLINPHVATLAAAPPAAADGTGAAAAAPRDSLTDLAAAALSYRDQLDKTSAAVAARGTRDTIRDITNVVLYGSAERAKASDGDLVRRLLELTQRSLGGAAGGARADAGLAAAQHDSVAAAELRRRMGLSARGAMQLALTLSRWPEAVEERELKAVLSLVEVPPPVAEAQGPVAAAERERRRLGELLGNLSNAGRRGAVPPRLLAALGDTGPVVGL
ncbi:hypothetical protein HXX76_004138 [Chlamydomonas incerta]|uniref:Uncharacterized protein n=1 Tax=Chlamydomonas incerta TaxID=51695 RepID=A0A835W8N5_CHLIN|nr:hypothetical protein HXX76_004138 [Chlamydomonas incerta]|eukprot:KAG2440021.1 hypothetical protein HXX76_004138 [Chlamydomonas incerta]